MSSDPEGGPALDEIEGVKQEQAWTTEDDPGIFSPALRYKLGELPMDGAAANIPWAGSYWPYFQDSINYRWAGAETKSPAEKYGLAFGVAGVEDAVSLMRGVDGGGAACTRDDECKRELSEVCGKRRGQSSGHCVGTWWGICHAWAPASILVAEPKYPVVENGVEFKVNDIKALATLVHDTVDARFVSRRCNRENRTGTIFGIEYDEFGRPTTDDCFDTNPGTLHLLVTNYLGVQRQSFVMDRVFDFQVWNQPIRSFQITKLTEVTASQASQLVGVQQEAAPPPASLPPAPSFQVAAGAWHRLEPVAVAGAQSLRVSITGTGDADLYVRFADWPTESAYDCRPYTGDSTESCDISVPVGATTAYVALHGYGAATGNYKVSVNRAGARYRFNDRAVRFYDVAMEIKYIVESTSATDGNLAGQIDNYTSADHLTYVLELDDQGRIIGGEYTGSSKQAHPDFLWLPLAPSAASVAGGKILYAKVKELLDRSLVSGNAGAGEAVDVTQQGSVAKDQLATFGPFDVATAASLVAEMSGTGDADLYVRKGAAPTMVSYDCRPYQSTSQEACTVAGPGQMYIGVNGYAASSTFSLRIRYTKPTQGVRIDDGGLVGGVRIDDGGLVGAVHLDTNGHVSQGQLVTFTMTISSGEHIVVATTGPNDIDVYLQMNRAPTTTDYAVRAYTSSGNETLSFVAPSAGTLFIGVHGYQESDFTLKTSPL